jgi:nucleotide-binding universal stress UspA family protein
MIRKVLIALDYNPTAQKVAETGYAVAKAMGAEVILLHVVAEATYYSSVQYSPFMGLNSFTNASLGEPDAAAEIRKAAARFLEKSRDHLGDTAIQTMVEEGDFADAILKAAASRHADMIVLGTHSRRGLDKILLGSVAESVVRHTPIPVFIIPIREAKK